MMKFTRAKNFLTSRTAQLAGTYLAIIMVMSIGFSWVFYHTSSRELGRQIPPDSYFTNGSVSTGIGRGLSQGIDGPSPVGQFLQERVDEGRSELLARLIIINVGALCVGSVVSYLLARRTLKPIEEAMDAQIQFVSDASHELRTPLTAIQTSNEVAMRKPKLSLAEAKQLIESNTEDIKRLKTLSDGLLNMAKPQKTVTLAPVKLQDMASEAMTQIVQQATAKDITVHDNIANISVLGNKSSLAQALVILLDNAVKYSGEHGNVYLETHKKGKHVYLDVRDEGIGIRASDLPHIFRRFYRADNARTGGNRSGYGLGLAIAKQLMTAQHGDVLVSSTPGKGSVFTIKLLSE